MDLFPKELAVSFFLMGTSIYGHYVGASWVFTVYFFTQGLIFLIFSLSLVEAFNLQPPPETQLLGLVGTASPSLHLVKDNQQRSTSRGVGRYLPVGMPDDFGSGGRRGGAQAANHNKGSERDTEGATLPRQRAPRLVHVVLANVIIFMYALPINAFSILLLYGVTTMALGEILHTQYDDVLALFLALFVIPLHMFWCLGSPSQNWSERKLARHGLLSSGTRFKHVLQLAVLYVYLFFLFLVSMYSSSATLQDYVSREVYHLTGKWLEEYIDRR